MDHHHLNMTPKLFKESKESMVLKIGNSSINLSKLIVKTYLAKDQFLLMERQRKKSQPGSRKN
jgi:hypothetical protein